MTGGMLKRLSISARLLILSVTLLAVIAGSNLYLTAALREASNKALDCRPSRQPDRECATRCVSRSATCATGVPIFRSAC